MTTGSASKSPRSGRSTAASVAALAAGAIIGAILPALAGLVLLGSAALRRPVLGRRIFSRIDGASGTVAMWQSDRAATRLTLVWGCRAGPHRPGSGADGTYQRCLGHLCRRAPANASWGNWQTAATREA
jgi:hypothetical protein